MSQRSHFWLRIVGLAVIVALEFGPRLWAGSSLVPATRVASTVANAR
jgi:hypothetical protein